MRPARLWPALALAAGLAACSDRESPTQPSEPAPPTAEVRAERAQAARLERIARRVALALGDPAFRAEVKAAVDRSPYREGKVHLQRTLAGDGGRGVAALARASGEPAAAVSADLGDAGALELYLPVPSHRTAWRGDERVLVATAERDGDAPVAFDPRGRRTVLDATVPPAEPVLAVVPAELDFDAPRVADALCTEETCGSTGAGGTGAVVSPPGLYMTRAEFTGDFEGWLKGSPEYEIHIMGPSAPGVVDELASFQCIGEAASSPYRWNADTKTWTGTQLLFSAAQLDAFASTFGTQPFGVMAYEDDDGGCKIKVDRDRFSRLMKAVAAAVADWNAAQGQQVLTPDGIIRIVKGAKSGYNLITALASFITTADDIIGVAVEDAATGRYRAGTNWTLLAENAVTNGWLKLEMK